MVLALSLLVYGLLCLAIARIFVRTGHSKLWVSVAFVPFGLVVFSYGLELLGYLPQLSRGILMIIVIVYLAILAVLSLKSWPSDKLGRTETFK
jgi:hypothetical protein